MIYDVLHVCVCVQFEERDGDDHCYQSYSDHHCFLHHIIIIIITSIVIIIFIISSIIILILDIMFMIMLLITIIITCNSFNITSLSPSSVTKTTIHHHLFCNVPIYHLISFDRVARCALSR